MNERPSYGAVFWSLRIGVKGATGVQAHQDLGMATFEVALKPDRIIAGVEDEQGSLIVGTVLLSETTAQSQDLLAGNVVGVLIEPDPACVKGSDPRIALES